MSDNIKELVHILRDLNSHGPIIAQARNIPSDKVVENSVQCAYEKFVLGKVNVFRVILTGEIILIWQDLGSLALLKFLCGHVLKGVILGYYWCDFEMTREFWLYRTSRKGGAYTEGQSVQCGATG